MNWRNANPWRSARTWRGNTAGRPWRNPNPWRSTQLWRSGGTVLTLTSAAGRTDTYGDLYQDLYGTPGGGGSVSGGTSRLTLVSASVLTLTSAAGGSASGGTAQLRLILKLVAATGGSQSAGTALLQLIDGSFTPNPPPPPLPPAERVLIVPLEARVYAVKG